MPVNNDTSDTTDGDDSSTRPLTDVAVLANEDNGGCLSAPAAPTDRK